MFNSNQIYNVEDDLTKKIIIYYEKINSNNYNSDATEFFKQQVTILRKRLDKIQQTIEDEDVNQDVNQDEQFDTNTYYSLRSWFADYYKTDYDHAYSLANEHCKTIASLYYDKYGYKPAKICREWLYKDDEKYREVTVNSYTEEEFESVIRPYFDECLEIESST